jgi:hypothetical protein
MVEHALMRTHTTVHTMSEGCNQSVPSLLIAVITGIPVWWYLLWGGLHVSLSMHAKKKPGGIKAE